MTVKPTCRFTTQAVIAMLAGDDLCDTCRGEGRTPVMRPRGQRTCPACGGRGIPRSVQDWVYDHVGRHDFKAYRQPQRTTR
jgi:DnaJ-class molecular chaperone